MNHLKLNIKKIPGRKLAVLILLVVSAVATFATLGDGRTKPNSSKTSLLSNRTSLKAGSFSLKSGYNFRGSKVINTTGEKVYINLNTVVTLRKGNTTYIVPLKKKIVFDKVKIDIGNRQFQRN